MLWILCNSIQDWKLIMPSLGISAACGYGYLWRIEKQPESAKWIEKQPEGAKCFVLSNHSKTYDFLTFWIFWLPKPFKNLWLFDLLDGFEAQTIQKPMTFWLFAILRLLEWGGPRSMPQLPRVAETQKSQKVIGFWMVWASKPSKKSKSHRFLNGLSFKTIEKNKKS